MKVLAGIFGFLLPKHFNRNFSASSLEISCDTKKKKKRIKNNLFVKFLSKLKFIFRWRKYDN